MVDDHALKAPGAAAHKQAMAPRLHNRLQSDRAERPRGNLPRIAYTCLAVFKRMAFHKQRCACDARLIAASAYSPHHWPSKDVKPATLKMG